MLQCVRKEGHPDLTTVKPENGHSKRPQIGFQDQLWLNAGQKYCRMLQGGHSSILLTFIKLPFVIKIFVLSIFERRFYTGFTVFACWVIFMLFLSSADFLILTFSKNSFRNMSECQTFWIQIRTDLYSVGPDLGQNCLLRLSADNKIVFDQKRVKCPPKTKEPVHVIFILRV